MVARVGIVDDHPATVLGVSSVINSSPGFRVVAAAMSVKSLLELTSRLEVILLDLQLPDGSTPSQNVLDLAKTGASIVVFTSGDNPELVRDAARAGVAGMLRKSESPDAIVRALSTALAGETVATPDWASALMEDEVFVSAQLTKRESEVLARYASGQTADQVAASLYVSRDTILDHLRRIRRRYASVGREAPTKIDLHRRAVEDGLVVTDPTST